MLAAVGDTVVVQTPLLCVYGARHAIDETALTNAIETGEERTFEQDPKYAIRLLVDIAIKALSPAINDATTAVQALNQIEDLLLRLGRRELEIGDFRDRDGRPRLIVPYPSWEDFLRLAFDEIASYGDQSVQVMRRMKPLVNDLTSRLPEDRHAALDTGRSDCNLLSRGRSKILRRSRTPRSMTGKAWGSLGSDKRKVQGGRAIAAAGESHPRSESLVLRPRRPSTKEQKMTKTTRKNQK